MTANLPYDWTEAPSPGVDDATFLVYEWAIANRQGRLLARYFGSATDARRPRATYAENVRGLLAGKGYHGGMGEYRRVHYCLADAVVKRRRVVLTLRANAPNRPAATALERVYQARYPHFCACGPHTQLRRRLNTYRVSAK